MFGSNGKTHWFEREQTNSKKKNSFQLLSQISFVFLLSICNDFAFYLIACLEIITLFSSFCWGHIKCGMGVWDCTLKYANVHWKMPISFLLNIVFGKMSSHMCINRIHSLLAWPILPLITTFYLISGIRFRLCTTLQKKGILKLNLKRKWAINAHFFFIKKKELKTRWLLSVRTELKHETSQNSQKIEKKLKSFKWKF